MSVTLQTTLGDIKIELYCDLCPKTCENFLALCASGYYDNCIFHRNIKDFMVQTGDPTGTGKGGDSIWGGPIEDELNTSLKHDARGVVSMAGNGPNTSRSQFFITYAKHPTLDLKYAIFGRVIDGFDVLDELEKVKVDTKYRPVIEQKIRNVIIHANPIAEMATTYTIAYYYFTSVSFLAKTTRISTLHLTNKIILRHLSDVKDDDKFDRKYPFEVEKEIDLETIREMQKYFEQYTDTEEYVEIENQLEAPSEIITKSDRLRRRLEPLLDFQQDSSTGPFSVKEIVEILRAERAQDIVCIKVPIGDIHNKYVIICTPHNMRHGEAMVLAIRKCFKLKTDHQVQPPKKAKIGQWLCYTFEDIALHIMTHEARLRYDLESLWGIGWVETSEDEVDISKPEYPVPAAN